MAFILVKSLKHVAYYGNIPEPMPGHEIDFEEWRLEQRDLTLLNDDFVDEINSVCGTLLDYGDVDYFDAEQCARLSRWLVVRIEKDCDPRLLTLYQKLLEFADRATGLGTGVVVEL